MNSENIEQAAAEKLPFLGSFNNFWRGRRVFVYKHPTDATKVVSIGYPLNDPNAKPFVCVENTEDYPSIESGVWRDYH